MRTGCKGRASFTSCVCHISQKGLSAEGGEWKHFSWLLILTTSPAGPSEIVLPDVGTEAPLHSQEEAQLGCYLSRLGFGNRDHLLPSNGWGICDALLLCSASILCVHFLWARLSLWRGAHPLAKLAGQCAPEILLSLLLQWWDYKPGLHPVFSRRYWSFHLGPRVCPVKHPIHSAMCLDQNL